MNHESTLTLKAHLNPSRRHIKHNFVDSVVVNGRSIPQALSKPYMADSSPTTLLAHSPLIEKSRNYSSEQVSF